MVSQVSVCSHGEQVGICGPMPFLGDGYLWYQVPSGGGYVGGVGMSKGWLSPGGHGTSGDEYPPHAVFL